MHQILQFIVEHMEFLWVGARFRITDSEVTTSNGGNAFVVLESTTVRLRIVRDKGQLFPQIQSRFAPSKRWIGIGIMYRFVRGAKPKTDLLDEELARFPKSDMEAIEAALSTGRWEASYARLTEVERARSRDLWG